MHENLEADRLYLLGSLPSCSQCGQRFGARACGPTHAIIAADPLRHRMFEALLAARDSQVQAEALLPIRRSVEALLVTLRAGRYRYERVHVEADLTYLLELATARATS